jgi:two-component system sensor histidine kinase AlgZ
MRFSDRLQVHIEADPDLLDAAVPHMGLQPVAENAVRHGIGCSVARGAIDVRASRVGGRLRIIVKNTGGIPRTGAPHGWGLGLANVRARLQQLYGAEAELRVECADGCAAVEVFVPYRRLAVATEPAVSMVSLQP